MDGDDSRQGREGRKGLEKSGKSGRIDAYPIKKFNHGWTQMNTDGAKPAL